MAAFTSKATGDWNAAGQTTWNEVGTPGAGDTATIQNTHTVTLAQNEQCDTLTIDVGGTLDLATFTLTGMTAETTLSGTLLGGDNCALTFNNAADRAIRGGASGVLNIVASSGNRALIDNVGAGKTSVLDVPTVHLDYVDIHSAVNGVRNSAQNAVSWYIDHCDIEGAGAGSVWGVFCINSKQTHAVWIRNSYISKFQATGRGIQVNGIAVLENVVFGVDIDGNAQANTSDFSYAYPATYFCNSVRSTAATMIHAATTHRGRIIAGDWGYAHGVGTPGIGYLHDGTIGIIERSVAAKKTGDYGARCTPLVDCDADRSVETSVYIPIATGDNIAVSVYGRRHTMTNDCAEVEIDPEGAWFTPATVATTLTNDDTWYEFAPSANGAGGSGDEGMVRIVLRLKEYQAGAYFDWADMVVTAGGTEYNVNFENWSMGIPQVAEPSSSGPARSPVGMTGGLV